MLNWTESTDALGQQTFAARNHIDDTTYLFLATRNRNYKTPRWDLEVARPNDGYRLRFKSLKTIRDLAEDPTDLDMVKSNDYASWHQLINDRGYKFEYWGGTQGWMSKFRFDTEWTTLLLTPVEKTYRKYVAALNHRDEVRQELERAESNLWDASEAYETAKIVAAYSKAEVTA